MSHSKIVLVVGGGSGSRAIDICLVVFVVFVKHILNV
jgi:hypothetical protein